MVFFNVNILGKVFGCILSIKHPHLGSTGTALPHRVAPLSCTDSGALQAGRLARGYVHAPKIPKYAFTFKHNYYKCLVELP